ncbi:MAG: peptide ABC transporter permease [Phototrophicales bacterium]|nr:MAG: peptide ABC transporter permease [Phototrophicales bacterium]RMG72999.1 MAG: ABC transporter permease [Chloroflexota bacterium]
MHLILRRVVIAIPTLMLLSLVVFLLLELAPGDAASALLDVSATAEQEAELRAELGLDQHVLVRYLRYLNGVLQGDFGVSARSGMSVAHEIGVRLPYTITLIAAAMLIATVFGIGLGFLSAVKHHSIWDTGITAVVSLGMALPTFWVALILVQIFAVELGWLPVFGADSPQHLILPAFCTAFVLIPGIARITRVSLLEAFNADFILFAQAKGIHTRQIITRHISPIAAISIVTYIGLQIVRLITSVAVMEVIFNYPGLGGLAVSAAFDRDFMMLQGVTLTIAVLTFSVLFIVDLIVAYLDPRIKL